MLKLIKIGLKSVGVFSTLIVLLAFCSAVADKDKGKTDAPLAVVEPSPEPSQEPSVEPKPQTKAEKFKDSVLKESVPNLRVMSAVSDMNAEDLLQLGNVACQERGLQSPEAFAKSATIGMERSKRELFYDIGVNVVYAAEADLCNQ